MLVSSPDGKREHDILPRLRSSGAGWRKLADVSMIAPKQMTHDWRSQTSLMESALMLEMEDIGQDLNSCEDHQPLSVNHIPMGFLNALLDEYNIQEQSLEDRGGLLPREVVTTSIRSASSRPF